MDLSDKEWNIVRTGMIIALLVVAVFAFSAINYLNEKNHKEKAGELGGRLAKEYGFEIKLDGWIIPPMNNDKIEILGNQRFLPDDEGRSLVQVVVMDETGKKRPEIWTMVKDGERVRLVIPPTSKVTPAAVKSLQEERSK